MGGDVDRSIGFPRSLLCIQEVGDRYGSESGQFFNVRLRDTGLLRGCHRYEVDKFYMLARIHSRLVNCSPTF